MVRFALTEITYVQTFCNLQSVSLSCASSKTGCMTKWEDRYFLLALASASLGFVLFVVDLGNTPLVFENIRAEVFLMSPLLAWECWRWLEERHQRSL